MLRELFSVKKYVDLHLHTDYSDGTKTVEEVVAIASQKGMSAIAITDHDCTDGFPIAQKLGEEFGMEVIPGVELSSDMQGVDIHILGYYVDIDNSALKTKLAEMKQARYERAQKIVANLNSQGVDLRFQTVLDVAGRGAIGRPHIAMAMQREELVYSFREAFDRYLGYDSPAYVEKFKMQPREVFELITQAGGIPVLAHPGVTRVDERITEFVRDGLLGIEIFHSEHSSAMERFYMNYVRKHHLAFTGGSDFHNGNQSKMEIGTPHVPYSAVESLKLARTSIFKEKG